MNNNNNNNKYNFYVTHQFVLFIYFCLTTIIFFLAVIQGNEGVTIKLFGGGDDGFFYWEQAKNVAANEPWVRTSIYPLIIGNIIKIPGFNSIYIIRIFNYLGFVLLINVSIKLISLQNKLNINKFNIKQTYRSKLTLSLFFLFWVSLQVQVNLSIYRDVWIYMLYMLSVLLSTKIIFMKNQKILQILLLMPVIWLLGEFRKYALLSFILSVIIFIIINRVKSTKRLIGWLLFAIVLFAIYYTYFKNFNVPIVNMSLGDVLNYRMLSLTTYSGGSQMWINLNQSNVFMFILNYIHSFIGNLIGPLPWHIRGMSSFVIFFVETIPMIIILKLLWKKRKMISKAQTYILLHALVWNGLIAMFNDNMGTAVRLRIVGWILILNVFVVVFFANKTSEKQVK